MHTFELEEQRSIVAEERWREHSKWCEKLADFGRLSFHSRRIALKILISEAYHRDRAHATSRGADASQLDELRRQWATIARHIERDMMTFDNSGVVLKNLSCMCVFIAGKVCREYGENCEDRQRRVEQQHALLQRLQEEGRLFDSRDPVDREHL